MEVNINVSQRERKEESNDLMVIFMSLLGYRKFSIFWLEYLYVSVYVLSNMCMIFAYYVLWMNIKPLFPKKCMNRTNSVSSAFLICFLNWGMIDV